MPDLERELRQLAPAIAFPAERDLAPAVRARLVAREPRRPIDWRRVAIVAVAAIVLLGGVAMAVPEARTALLELVGIKGATVIRVEDLPPAGRARPFGEAVTLAEVARVVGFRPLLPDLGPPDGVRVDRFVPEFVVLLWGRPRIAVRLTELRGGWIAKYARIEQRVERVSVDGRRGIWVEGRHVVSEPFGLPRLSGNVLLWEQSGLTLRLEGRLTREQALALAATVR